MGGKSSGTTDQKIPISHFSSLPINKMIYIILEGGEKGKNIFNLGSEERAKERERRNL